MHFNLFKGASPPTGEGHSFCKPMYPPPPFIDPLSQKHPLTPRTETLAVTNGGQRGLPPPPLPRASASLRRKPAIGSRDPMGEMLQDIDYLLADYGCNDQHDRNPCTTFLLRRVPGDGLWLNYKRNAETIILTHNFDSVYVFTLGLMHQSLGKRNIRPTLLAESHSHHDLAYDVSLLVPIAMYSDLINTCCWKKHKLKDLPPGFECGFSRVIN
ncbi:hypothetical protein HZ326_31487, partial [Fusarium oxysporum f. sp. albedinis]